ncbi:2-succinyl-5-enolpyruvyl-6-hydroxy-3-cyclohexene-1-carboxylic-acid synthase [Oerskovia flava]|uniref:2-succinyl-5-enolpyruvyl-6-hydroxy-3- cyclohexene-1-carboxylic-acid synthase n=1 Tax=Oerskovia flava TaxID=2986422 RepID=UPI0022402789|nr:2-succinyl-5-enolpyruvyl-6-hydroxy-3-cyclohexene-1-carboxylic-acid synthase [Oerskovia sp. JB1-3-2]
MNQPPSIVAARRLVADLVAGGVADVVLAPGSRSAPLAYAVAEAADAGRLRLHVRIDERSAAFLALGLARGAALTGAGDGPDGGEPSTFATRAAPVAVVTTSGTAAANLHPAVLEAHHSGVPLVLLTADRPHELRGTGANQTVDQVGLYGSAVRLAVDVPAPTGRADEPRDLSTLVTRALAAARGDRSGYPGPVHLNLAFRDPLVPTSPLGSPDGPDAGTDRRPERRAVVVPAVAAVASLTAVPWGSTGAADDAGLAEPPTVLVAGDGAGAAARRLAEARGWPLLAEASSGAAGGANLVRAHRLVLGADALVEQVRRVVVLGRATLSRPVQTLLGRPGVEVVVVAPGAGPWPDAARNASVVLPAVPDAWWDRPVEGPGAWCELWVAAGDAAAAVVATHLQGPTTALAVAAEVAAACHPGDVLVVGSSNPVRDLDLVAGWDEAVHVVANRGAAGIDGTVSTATGIALAAGRAGRRTHALLGDLTFLHDAGGLLRGPAEEHVDLQIVVVNDDGGSIFASLEHGALAAGSRAAHRTFERVFSTPHGAHLAQVCAGYGVDHQLVTDTASLRHALASPTHGVQVIEVPVPRADRRTAGIALAGQVRDAVAEVLRAR